MWQRVVSLFLAWAVMQGVAMLLQNHYQRQRLYTRIALGKVGFTVGTYVGSERRRLRLTLLWLRCVLFARISFPLTSFPWAVCAGRKDGCGVG